MKAEFYFFMIRSDFFLDLRRMRGHLPVVCNVKKPELIIVSRTEQEDMSIINAIYMAVTETAQKVLKIKRFHCLLNHV